MQLYLYDESGAQSLYVPFKLTVYNKAPIFIGAGLQDQKISFNITKDYYLPPFEDPEGMPVYISFYCIPDCGTFATIINDVALSFNPRDWGQVRDYDVFLSLSDSLNATTY